MTEPEPGGSLLIAWQLKARPVLLVGGGEVAAHRLAALLSADALVILIAPSPLHRNIIPLLSNPIYSIAYHDRLFEDIDIERFSPSMVLTALDDVTTSRSIAAQCRERHIPINVADDPPACDFYFGSIIRRGPLQILISTNGNGPKLANLVKKRLEGSLPEGVGTAVEKVGQLRRKLRERVPEIGGDIGRRRMRWMSKLCEAWEIDELASLDEESMERLLDLGWETGLVPKSPEIFVQNLGQQRNRNSVPSRNASLTLSMRPFMTGLVGGMAMTTIILFIMQRRAW
ncbi:siroheme synthase [Hysterangium stoloniferum]|nr:siroheme synthase [Hysterangium stoloniferum]